jgi:hypothetical protein
MLELVALDLRVLVTYGRVFNRLAEHSSSPGSLAGKLVSAITLQYNIPYFIAKASEF